MNPKLKLAIGNWLGSEAFDWHKWISSKMAGLAFLPEKCREILQTADQEYLYKAEVIFYWTSQRLPDGLTLVPSADGKQHLWVVYLLDLNRNDAWSVYHRCTAAAESEEQKHVKHKDLVDDGYLFKKSAWSAKFLTISAINKIFFLKQILVFILWSWLFLLKNPRWFRSWISNHPGI